MLLRKKRGWYEKDIVINYGYMFMFLWPEEFGNCTGFCRTQCTGSV